jgi:glycosyltransferase involved in cell wall biosynthesis
VVRVAVCVVTFRRPAGLGRALLSLEELVFDASRRVDVEIVVVDNDPDESARATVEASAHSRFPVRYAVEPRRGIPFARNTAVARADDPDFVAFLDDDEWAEPSWLDELLSAQVRTGADVVAGPVLASFDVTPPRWLQRANYFAALDYGELEQMHFANTGNVLVGAHVFRDVEPPFSERYAATGGEDTHFFLRAVQRGYRIVWAPAARVNESVTPERMRVAWILRREFRRGATLSMCLLDLEPSWRRRLKRIGHGSARITIGAALTALGLIGGQRVAFAGLRQGAFGGGLLFGLTGRGFAEYADGRR